MATVRYYVTNVAASYTPSTKRGAWDTSAAANDFEIATAKAGNAGNTAQVASGGTGADHDTLCARFVSPALEGSGSVSIEDFCLGFSESSTSGNYYPHLHIWVTQGDSDTLRGTILNDWIGTAEVSGSANTSGYAATPSGAASVDYQAGDHIVVEVGGRDSVATSYNFRTYYGGTVADQTQGGGYTAGTPWIDFVITASIPNVDVVGAWQVDATHIDVQFSGAVQASPPASGFTLDNGATVSAAVRQADTTIVRLTTSALTPETVYTVTADSTVTASATNTTTFTAIVGRLYGVGADSPAAAVSGYRYRMNLDYSNSKAVEDKNFTVKFPAKHLAARGFLRSDYADIRVARSDGTILPCVASDWSLTVGWLSSPFTDERLWVWFGGGATPPNAPAAGSSVVFATDVQEFVDTEGTITGFGWFMFADDLETACISQANGTTCYNDQTALTVGKGTGSDEWKALIKPFIGALPIGKVASASFHAHLGSAAYAESGTLQMRHLATTGATTQSFYENVGAGWGKQANLAPTWNTRMIDYQASDAGTARGWYNAEAGCGASSYKTTHADLALTAGFAAGYKSWTLDPADLEADVCDARTHAQGYIIFDAAAAGASNRKASLTGSDATDNKPVLEVWFSEYATRQMHQRKMSTNTDTYATFATQDRYGISLARFGVLLYVNAEMKYDVLVYSKRGRVKRVAKNLAPAAGRFDVDGQCGGLDYDPIEHRFYVVGTTHSNHLGIVGVSDPYDPSTWSWSGALPRQFYKGQLVVINGVAHAVYSDGAAGDVYHTRYTRSSNALTDTGMVVSNAGETGYCQYVVGVYDPIRNGFWLVWTLANGSVYEYVAALFHDFDDADDVWRKPDMTVAGSLPLGSVAQRISEPSTKGYPEDVNVLSDGTVTILYAAAENIQNLKLARLTTSDTAFAITDVADFSEASSCDFPGGIVKVTGIQDPNGLRRSIRCESTDYGATFSEPEPSALYPFVGAPLWLSGCTQGGDLGFGLTWLMEDAHFGALFVEDTEAPATPPAAPISVTASVDGTDVAVTLVDNADNEEGVRYKVAYDGGAYGDPVTITTPDTTGFSFAYEAGHASVQVAVCAYNASGDSAYVESNVLYFPLSVGPSTGSGSANVDAALGQAVPIAATAAGVASITATVGELRALLSAAVGSAGVSAAPSAQRPLTAAATGSGAVSAALGALRAFTAVADGSASVDAALTTADKLALTGTAEGTAAVSAVVGALARIAASGAGAADVSAELAGMVGLEAAAAGDADVSAAISGGRTLQEIGEAAAQGAGSVEAALGRMVALASASAGRAIVTAVLTSPVELRGPFTLTLTAADGLNLTLTCDSPGRLTLSSEEGPHLTLSGD